MSASKRALVFLTLFVSTSLLLVSVQRSNAATDQSQAASALSDAEAVVVDTCAAVSKADAAGANVSSVLFRLNEAGEALTRARAAYGLGDYDSALTLAVLCQERLNGLVAEADALTEAAVRDSHLDFMVNVVGSIVGSVSIFCGGLIFWVHLSRRYAKA